MDIDEFEGDIYDWNIYTIIKYVKIHYVQFLLLFVVFIIIYVVDHISNINAMIFAMPSVIPSALSTTTTIPMKLKKPKKLKK
jgi:hypothetical protein